MQQLDFLKLWPLHGWRKDKSSLWYQIQCMEHKTWIDFGIQNML